MPPIKQRRIAPKAQAQSFNPNAINQPDVYSQTLSNLGKIAENVSVSLENNRQRLFNSTSRQIINNGNKAARLATNKFEAAKIMEQSRQEFEANGKAIKGEGDYNKWQSGEGKYVLDGWNLDNASVMLKHEKDEWLSGVDTLILNTANELVENDNPANIQAISKDALEAINEGEANGFHSKTQAQAKINKLQNLVDNGKVRKNIRLGNFDELKKDLTNSKKYTSLTPAQKENYLSAIDNTNKSNQQNEMVLDFWYDHKTTSPDDIVGSVEVMKKAQMLEQADIITQAQGKKAYLDYAVPLGVEIASMAKKFDGKLYKGGSIQQYVAYKFTREQGSTVFSDKFVIDPSSIGASNESDAINAFGSVIMNLSKILNVEDVYSKENQSTIDKAIDDELVFQNRKLKKSKIQIENNSIRATNASINSYNNTKTTINKMNVDDFGNSPVGTIAVVNGKKVIRTDFETTGNDYEVVK